MKTWAWIILTVSALAPAAQASTITVNTTSDQFGSDSAHCSLREAVQAANTNAAFGGCTAGSGADHIVLPAGVFAFTRSGRDEDANSTGDLDITESLLVSGDGAATTIIDANGLDRIFHTQQSSSGYLIVLGLTLRNGDPTGGSDADDIYGGAILMEGSGLISLLSVNVTGNRAAEGGGVYVDNGATTLGISTSSFSANFASRYGGAVSTRRGLNTYDSTFSGNIAECVGSAFYFSTSQSDHLLAGVTVADNHSFNDTCVAGPALWNSLSSSSAVHVRNSIIARNFSGFEESNCDEITSDDYNLIGSTEDCDIVGATANTLTNIDPKLQPLFDYGSGTPTHMILPGSAAIGAGNPAPLGSGGNSCSTTDQRGVARNDCDIGAYEYNPTFTVTRTQDVADATPGNGQCDVTGGGCTLRAAIAEANARTEPTMIVLPAGTYHVSLPNAPNEDTGDLEVKADSAVTIVGAGADRTTVLGDGSDRVLFSLTAQANALLRFAVRGGHEQGAVRAGGISAHAETLLADLEIADNQGCSGGLSLTGHVIAERLSIHDNLAEISGGCPYTGGGVDVGTNGALDMRNSTISGNRARQGGGGLFVDGGTARLVNVTIADNTSDYLGGSTQGGGGIGRGSSGLVYLKNSIVADNASGTGVGPDCAAIVQSQDFNLIEDTSDCTIGGESTHNITGTDPRLTQLAMLGGALPVHGLLAGSPAIDGVGEGQTFDRALACRDGGLRSITEDQRGIARPIGSFCDIGAFEGTADLIFANGFD